MGKIKFDYILNRFRLSDEGTGGGGGGTLNLVSIASTVAGFDDPVANSGKLAFLTQDDGANDSGFYLSNGAAWIFSNIDITAVIDTVNPTVSNDGTQGFIRGQIWINSTTKDIFISADVSTGAAKWTKITTPSIDNWAATTAYQAGNVVATPSGALVVRNNDGTSGAQYNDAEATEWILIISTYSVGTLQNNTYYYEDQVAVYNNYNLKRVNDGFFTLPFDITEASEWVQDSITKLVDGFSASTVYLQNQIVFQSNALWSRNINGVSGIWDATEELNWTKIANVATETRDKLVPSAQDTIPSLSNTPESDAQVKFFINGVYDYENQISSTGQTVTVAGTIAATYGFNIETTDVVTAIYF